LCRAGWPDAREGGGLDHERRGRDYLIANRLGFGLVSVTTIMFKRVPQPPVNPALRDTERHDFWPGFIAILIGVALVFCGARHLTGVDTTAGSTAWETQLIQAFSVGGIQYADRLATPPPPKPDNSPASAEALERWARENANASPPTWKVRVDIGAKKACPT
jgi:hypothetical protein